MGIKFEAKRSYHMGQRYAKHQVQSGVRVYHQRHYQQAIGRWRAALNRLKSAEDRFITFGYMAQAFCDCSDYESMLHYALQQMELANMRNDDFMKCEAFLNLSKAYERLADFGKAISFGNASLQHPSIDARTPGYAHLGIALSQLGLSQFQSGLEEFEKAMSVANDTGDKLLELQICVGLGSLFTLLKDLNKAIIFLRNALTILQLITVDNVHAKYKSTILYHLSVVLRHKGSLADAHKACEEALLLSYQTANKSIYARALCSMADINRELGESEAKETITKSWARYEQSFRLMRQINDRMGEVIVLGSMAKSASESRTHYTGQCECQSIQLNKKCLELAKMIGCKHAIMKCHLRLQELYSQLADEDSEEMAAKACVSLIQEMELFCNFCGQRYGENDNSLQALRCSHIFHEKCLHRFLFENDNPSCPKCQRKAIVMNIKSEATSSDDDKPKTEAQMQENVAIINDDIDYPMPAESDDTVQNRTMIVSRRKPKLESFKRQTFPQNQGQIEMTTSFQQRQLNDPEFYHREIKSSPFIRKEKGQTIVYKPISESTQNVLDAIDLDAIDKENQNATTTIAPSSSALSIRNFPYHDYSETGSVPLLSSTAPVELFNTNKFQPIEIASDTAMQHFSLSASTSSIAYYPSSSDATLSCKALIKRSSRMSEGSAGGSTSTQSSSWSNQPPALLQLSQRRFPSRAERLGLTTMSNSPPLDMLTDSLDEQQPSTSGILKFNFTNSKDNTTILSPIINVVDKPPSATFASQQNTSSNTETMKPTMLYQKPILKTTTFTLSDCKEFSKPITVAKPPPPPIRKPCCATDGFPILSEELMNTKPSTSTSYSTMVERAMRPVLEECEFTLNNDSGCVSTAVKCTTQNSVERKKSDANQNNRTTFVVHRGPGVTDV